MKKFFIDSCNNIVFTNDNPDNIRKVMTRCKNVLICGIKGVGKITNSIKAIKDNDNVYYIGNPVDFEGKRRPGSYEKYIQYILFQKNDITIAEDMDELLKTTDEIILIIDEIYGRSDEQLRLISRVLDMKNIRVLQIVGCLKYMGVLIDKIDVILQLHPDMAFAIDRDFAKAICDKLGKK
jgi:hypothetical protein